VSLTLSPSARRCGREPGWKCESPSGYRTRMASPRIVLLGATGHTGRLTAEALVRRGVRPLLAGRDAARLTALAASFPDDLEVAVADVNHPEAVSRILRDGDVLVSTVGPFTRWGEAAALAAVEAGAIYFDSTGEPTFIRRVFQRYGPAAEKSGAALVTAFGYDYVPGNLAAALALRKAGPEAVRVDVGYFVRGDIARRSSAGTRASALGAVLEPMYGFRDGRIRHEQGRTRRFDVGGERRYGISIGASEHFALPRAHRGLREVNVYLGALGTLGGLGGLTRAVGVLARVTPLIAALPGARRATEALADHVLRTGRAADPDAAAPAPTAAGAGTPISAQIVAETYDRTGRLLSAVRLAGGDPYLFTADILAWAAGTAAGSGVAGTGALGPVDAFGLDTLARGCAEAGLTEATG
jgi:hypothetical protein